MTWNELPVEIQEKAREYMNFSEGFIPSTLGSAFMWGNSPEGGDFWKEVDNGNFNVFYEKYPKKHDFVLPTKWAIKITRESREVLREYSKAYGCGWLDGQWLYYTGGDIGRGDSWSWNKEAEPIRNKHYVNEERYSEISYEQFLKYVLNQDKQSTMKENKLTRKQLVEAYNSFSCSKWQERIKNLLKQHATVTDDTQITIPEEDIKLLLSEGTKEQRKYVESLGITLKEDKNAFVKKFTSSNISSFSKEIFGNDSTLQIAVFTTVPERGDLLGRSFLLSQDYTVNLIPKGGKTIIEITKK